MSAEGTVLVVDDELSVRDIISRGLVHQGFDCRSARDARQALAMAEGESSELVVSDIRMPGRGGVWLLKQLKDRWPDTAVIMLTAVSEAKTAIDCLRMGADDYLTKPVNLAELGISARRNIDKVRLVKQNRKYQQNLEQMVEERTAKLHQALFEIRDTYQSTLEALAASLDAREHETGCHSQRVMRFTAAIARQSGVPE